MKGPTSKLPTGTVTFLFTDIEGSTNLARALGDRWPEVLEAHHAILRGAVRHHGGIDIQTEGDALFAVFRSAVDAVAACADAQRGLSGHAWPPDGPVRVRMGMHTGEGRLRDGNYHGLDVHRASRISAAGHGGQVLASATTRSLAADKLPEGVAFRDLGAYRLKDFDESQVIYQLVIRGLPADFPPLMTLDIPTNLPAELTSFIGRERELAQIEQMLDSARLVTLTGPGGSGKTRLAQHAASELVDRYPDGVFFVDLSSTRDAELVPSVIAGALGIREEGPRPLLETLKTELRERSTLLVLDNFEQVIDAARMLSSLLAAVPRVRLLVTSRGPLRIQGEHEFAVSPLALPDAAGDSRSAIELSRFEAVTLFVERARAVDPGFELTDLNAATVAEIARRLDGLPLALELAASRVRLLTPQAMLERLDRALPLLAGGPRDVPARQRTLRGAIEWSYDLLPADVASLFRRLSVFAGGFGFDAVDAVCHPVDLGVDALEGLEVLLDNALIRKATGTTDSLRFDTLQTIREFGRERLAHEEAEADVGRRHAEYFLALAERAAPELRGPRSEQYLDLLELEHDNLRAALTWALEGDEGDIALRLIGALWRFWHLRGHLTGGRRWASRALGLPSAGARSATRVKALIGEGGLAYWQTDPPAVRRAADEALEIAKELGDTQILAEAIYNSAFWHPFDGDFATAGAILREALAMYRELGDRVRIADTLFAISILDRLQGDLESGLTTGKEALRIHRDLGDMFGMTGSLFALGRTYAEMGDLETARSLFLESLALAQRMQDRTGIAIFLDNLAEQANLLGDHARAMRIAGASQAVKDAVGGEAPPALVHLPDPREIARQHLSEEEMKAAWHEGYQMRIETAVAYAREPVGVLIQGLAYL